MNAQGAFLTLELVGSWCLLSFPNRFASRDGPPRVPWLNGSDRRSGRRSEQNQSQRASLIWLRIGTGGGL
jgi:hypothetical protein